MKSREKEYCSQDVWLVSSYLEGHGLFPVACSGLLDPDPLSVSAQRGGSAAPQWPVHSVSSVLRDPPPCPVSAGQCHLHSLQTKERLSVSRCSYDGPFCAAETVLPLDVFSTLGVWSSPISLFPFQDTLEHMSISAYASRWGLPLNSSPLTIPRPSWNPLVFHQDLQDPFHRTAP